MVSKEKKEWLYNAFNGTSTDDGQGDIETYENWLERQLLSRIEKLKEYEDDDKNFLLEHVFEKMDVIAHFECINPPLLVSAICRFVSIPSASIISSPM